MIINRNNYEAIVIDYLDGNLSPAQVELLMAFLNQNPDIAEEVEIMKSASLPNDEIRFEHKSQLKKPSFSKNGISNEFDYLCIAELEDDISEDERKNLNLLSNESSLKQKQRSLFTKLILETDKNIEFTGKASLKKTPILHIQQNTFRNVASIAAGLALLLGLFQVFNLTNKVSETIQVARVEKSSIIESEKLADNSSSLNEERNAESVDFLTSKKNSVAKKVKLVETLINEEENQLASITEQEKMLPISTIDIKSIPIKTIPHAKISISKETVRDFVADENLLAENQNPRVNGSGSSRELGLFDIVQLGVEKLSMATGSNIQLSTEKDQRGRLTKIDFESNLFALSTPVRRK